MFRNIRLYSFYTSKILHKNETTKQLTSFRLYKIIFLIKCIEKKEFFCHSTLLFVPLHFVRLPIMTEGLVSVIMPTYNTVDFLADSIESILNQTYTNLELLITDDCSSDKNTIDLLNKYAQKDDRVKLAFLKDNLGPGVARNNAIERAQGQYIAFCDSDDRWMPNKLELQIAAMKNGGYTLCCSSYIICDENNNNIGINISPQHITFSMMKRDNKVGCLTAIYDIRALGRKYYMPKIRKRQDWALFLEIISNCHNAYGIKEPLAYYRKRVNSVSSNKIALIKYNIAVYRQCLHFGKFKSLAYFAFCFLPSYTAKVIKQKIDSFKYRINIRTFVS